MPWLLQCGSTSLLGGTALATEVGRVETKRKKKYTVLEQSTLNVAEGLTKIWRILLSLSPRTLGERKLHPFLSLFPATEVQLSFFSLFFLNTTGTFVFSFFWEIRRTWVVMGT